MRPLARREAPLALILAAAVAGFGPACTSPDLRGRARATGPGAPPSPTVAPAGVTEVASSAPLGSLTLRKWRLSNGLLIITAPDPGARAVSYVTAYNVGSRDEDAGRGETGLAHLCEHLMFTQTRGGRGPGDFDRRIEEMGGSNNATTDYDFTSYVDDIPADALERTIALEADRMINLELGDAAVATEREVVIEERLMTAEDDIDGQLDELVYGQAFRVHPYRFPVVGRMADIKAVTKERVTAFYGRHYGPDRAVVIVAGRFDENAALAAITAAYSPLPARGTSATVIAPERAPAAEIRSEVERPVPADRFMVGYPAPGLGDADRPAYELLDELLTGGPSARLYRLLVVERELASTLEAELAATRDPALWTIVVQMLKGRSAAAGEDVIRREIDKVIATAPTQGELDAARNRLETAFWTTLGSSQGRAEALARFEATTGDFRTLINRGAAYARVSPADLSRVARDYLGPGARSVVVAHPKGASPE